MSFVSAHELCVGSVSYTLSECFVCVFVCVIYSLARNLRGDFALAHFELVVDNEDHLSGPICYTKVVA